MAEKFKIIVSKSELGAGTYGASLGPDAIKVAFYEDGDLLFQDSKVEKVLYDKEHIARGTKNQVEYFKLFLPLLTQIATITYKAMRSGYKCLLLSGDHSNAIGFVAGIKDAFPKKRIGVIWIDAHGDLHTPYTSPSLNVHGMSIGALLGLNDPSKHIVSVKPLVYKVWEKILRVGDQQSVPKIQPQDIVYIGIRDLETLEWDLIKKLGIKYFSSDDVQHLGVKEVLEETEKHLKGCDVLYISFDVDSLDPSVSRGTGTPVRNGLTVSQAQYLLSKLYRLPKTRALDVSEVNPLLDSKNDMAKVVARILQKVL
jgi:arginase